MDKIYINEPKYAQIVSNHSTFIINTKDIVISIDKNCLDNYSMTRKTNKSMPKNRSV